VKWSGPASRNYFVFLRTLSEVMFPRHVAQSDKMVNAPTTGLVFSTNCVQTTELWASLK
jgi:hypothetical protein